MRATPPPFQLTERDVAILREVARHRLLRSTHVSLLLDAPHKKVSDRLTRLFHAGYLERPRAQLAYHVAGGGSSPMIYGLSPRGARLLAEHGDATPTHVVAADCDRLFCLHTLAVSDFRVALRVVLRGRPDVRLIDDEALPAPPATPLRVDVAGAAAVAIVPDYVFSLQRANGARRNYCVEMDRGTMPVARASLAQTSVIRKVVAYAAAREQRLFERQYGWRNFRVLIATATAERADHIRAAIAASTTAPPLFLVGAQEVVTADPLVGWGDVQGKPQALF